jgi:hypothetical protein
MHCSAQTTFPAQHVHLACLTPTSSAEVLQNFREIDNRKCNWMECQRVPDDAAALGTSKN